MTDLRSLLEQAAGEPPLALPMANIRRRGKTLTRRRRLIPGTVIAAVIVLAGAGIATHPPARITPSKPPPATVVTTGPLEAGTYTDPALTPGVTFVIPDSALTWRATVATSTSLVLVSDTLDATISLQRWTDVYQPIGGTARTPAKTRRPADLITWLALDPALRSGKPEATLLGNQPAHTITFTLDPHRRLPTGPARGCTAAADCLALAETPDNPVVIYPRTTTTVITPDHDPAGLVLTIAVNTVRLPYATPNINNIIGTLTIG